MAIRSTTVICRQDANLNEAVPNCDALERYHPCRRDAGHSSAINVYSIVTSFALEMVVCRIS